MKSTLPVEILPRNTKYSNKKYRQARNNSLDGKYFYFVIFLYRRYALKLLVAIPPKSNDKTDLHQIGSVILEHPFNNRKHSQYHCRYCIKNSLSKFYFGWFLFVSHIIPLSKIQFSEPFQHSQFQILLSCIT